MIIVAALDIERLAYKILSRCLLYQLLPEHTCVCVPVCVCVCVCVCARVRALWGVTRVGVHALTDSPDLNPLGTLLCLLTDMPGLMALRKDLAAERKLSGAKIVCCSHVTAHGAVSNTNFACSVQVLFNIADNLTHNYNY